MNFSVWELEACIEVMDKIANKIKTIVKKFTDFSKERYRI